MSPDQIEGPFDTIESAHEFMTVLASHGGGSDRRTGAATVSARCATGDLRRAQAIDLALYKLKTLNCYVLQRPAGAERSAHAPPADFERADDARKRHCGDVIVLRPN